MTGYTRMLQLNTLFRFTFLCLVQRPVDLEQVTLRETDYATMQIYQRIFLAN